MMIARWASHLSDVLRRRRPFVFVPWNNDVRVNDPYLPWVVYYVSYESTQVAPGSWTVVDVVCWYCQRTSEILVRLMSPGSVPTLSVERDRFLQVHAHGAEYPPVEAPADLTTDER